jgi:hypothetical protein
MLNFVVALEPSSSLTAQSNVEASALLNPSRDPLVLVAAASLRVHPASAYVLTVQAGPLGYWHKLFPTSGIYGADQPVPGKPELRSMHSILATTLSFC